MDLTWSTSPAMVHKKEGTPELFLPDCIAHKWQRKIGCMFWGCISGAYSKGSGLFWEKKWKSVTSFSYCEHTFIMVWNYMYCEGHPGLVFQQDGGLGRTSVIPWHI
jgi:hypothetical protein